MKIENTPENKYRLFDLYRRLKVGHWKDVPNDVVLFFEDHHYKDSDFCLLLTPLSQITDEDAIELIKLQFDKFPKEFKMLEFDRSFKNVPSFTYSFIDGYNEYGVSEMALLGGSKDFNRLSVKQTMYAIRKGYYVGDGTEIEYNWVKLKESK